MSVQLALKDAERLVCTPILEVLFARHLQQQSVRIEKALARFDPDKLDRAQVRQDAVNWLRFILGRLTNELVFERFSAFRSVHNRFWRPGSATGATSQNALLNDFAASPLWLDYFGSQTAQTVLGELINKVIENWFAAVTETVVRMDENRSGIANVMVPEASDPGRLMSIDFGLSDLHGNGRAVAIARFDLGKIVYKPRDIVTEVIWNDLMGFVSQRAFNRTFPKPRLLVCEAFGFVEFIAHEPCQTVAEVDQCFEMFGAIVALAHGLGTTDLHHENIIVRGAIPYVVDAETLLPASLRPRDDITMGGEASVNPALTTFASIYELGLLPVIVEPPKTQIAAADKEPLEQIMGGFAPYGIEPINAYVPVAMNSDNVTFASSVLQQELAPNLPVWQARTVLPADHVETLVEGFETAYDVVSAARTVVSDKISTRMDRARIRLVPRPTRLYSTILTRSISSEALASDHIRRKIIRDDLVGLSKAEVDVDNTLLDLEIEQLVGADVPRFELGARDDGVDNADLGTPPLDQMQDRLAALCPEDKTLQAATLRLSVSTPAKFKDTVSTQTDPRLTRLKTLCTAISDAAQWDDDGAWWPQVTNDSGRRGTRVHRDREALYDGSAGTALAMAEIGVQLGNSTLTSLAKASLMYPESGAQAAQRGPGLARGLAGFSFVLLRAGAALDDDQMIVRATALLREHGPGWVQNGAASDLLFGDAGLLMTALLADRINPHPDMRSLADSLARKLVAARFETPDGCVWPTEDGRPASLHAAHGPTGIAVALSKWAALRGDEQTLGVIRSAFRSDGAYWMNDVGGWQHLPGDADPVAGWSWCGGRAGALSARLIARDLVGVPIDIQHIQAAVMADPNGSLTKPTLGLCCGTAGILDALIRAHEALLPCGDANLTLCDGIARRIEDADALLTGSAALRKINPLFTSLFSGCAGASMALARSIWTDDIRSLVWFD